MQRVRHKTQPERRFRFTRARISGVKFHIIGQRRPIYLYNVSLNIFLDGTHYRALEFCKDVAPDQTHEVNRAQVFGKRWVEIGGKQAAVKTSVDIGCHTETLHTTQIVSTIRVLKKPILHLDRIPVNYSQYLHFQHRTCKSRSRRPRCLARDNCILMSPVLFPGHYQDIVCLSMRHCEKRSLHCNRLQPHAFAGTKIFMDISFPQTDWHRAHTKHSHEGSLF